MSSILGNVFQYEAQENITNKLNNEIKVENFVVQLLDIDDKINVSSEKIISEKVGDCKKTWGWYSDKAYAENHKIYYVLYKRLIDEKIILQKFSLFSFITIDYKHTVDPNLTENQLETAIKNITIKNPTFNCYEINVKKLFIFLKNFKNKIFDNVKMLQKDLEEVKNEFNEINKKNKGGRKRKRKTNIRRHNNGKRTRTRNILRGALPPL